MVLAVVSDVQACLDMLVPNLCFLFDRRWPAILLGDLELIPNGSDNIFLDTLYTAAIWQVIRDQVTADRTNVGLHLLKRLYKIGCGAGFVRRELFLKDEQNLLERPCPQPQEGAGTTRWPKDTELMSTAKQMLARIKEAPEVLAQWEGDHTAFMIRCAMMAQEWRGNVPFGDFELRCQVAVKIAIGSTKVHDEAKLVVAWINHRDERSCAALRAVIILDRRLFSECGKRLLSCLVEFIVQPALLKYEISPRSVPTMDRDLVTAPSGSESDVAGWLKERPEPVSRWHLVPVPETPRVADGLSGALYGRLHRPRGASTAASKRGGYDYSSLDLHAHGGTLSWRRSAEKERERGGASTLNAAGGNFAPEAGVPASTASTTKQEERERSPTRLVIAETPAQSQEAAEPEHEGVITLSQSRSPS